MDRVEAIARIRKGLRRRSGKAWSVRGGRGTAYGWITICAPPARCDSWGAMLDGEASELAELLALPSAHQQGVVIPPGGSERAEMVARAEGKFSSQRSTARKPAPMF